MERAVSPPRASGPAGKVRTGFFSFTEVTDPGAHRSYNEWHQLDHLPEQLPLRGLAAGQRWVATPACRRARACEGDLLAPVHYVTLYLMTDPLEETLEEFWALGEELRRARRFHRQRHSWLSGPFDVVGAASAPRVLVSAAAVAFRPNTGVYVVVEEAEPGDDVAWRRPSDPGEMLAVDGVAGVWCFTAAAAETGRWDPGRRRVTVCFLDGPPLESAGPLGALAGAPERRPSGVAMIFAGPFETISPWHWDWFDGDDSARGAD